MNPVRTRKKILRVLVPLKVVYELQTTLFGAILNLEKSRTNLGIEHINLLVRKRGTTVLSKFLTKIDEKGGNTPIP